MMWGVVMWCWRGGEGWSGGEREVRREGGEERGR
jgi:hypothetical protein